MPALIAIMALTLITVLVVEIGNRVRLPWPALMVLVGLGIAWIPAGHLDLPNELVLPLLLPPLLFTAAERTSWQMFRRRWRIILLFAVALTVVTVAVVAGVGWLLYPGIGLPAALILGAMVAPPDPVAVEAVARTLPFPRRILSTLQTEGLFNDAVALVVFEVALVALMTGHEITPSEVLGDLLLGMVLAVVVGWVLAFGIRFIVRLSDSAVASAAATVVLPYAAYLIADHLEASGVLAVVVAALEYRRTESPDDVEERLVRASFWEVAELILTGLAFGLIGEGFQEVLRDYGAEVWGMAGKGLAVAATVVGVRLLYLLVLTRHRQDDDFQAPRNLREVVVMTWGGMRGLITLALAVSLPAAIGPEGAYFAHRPQIVVAACMVLVVTLLLAGLTMPVLMRKVGLESEAETERAAEAELVRIAGAHAHRAVTAIPDLPEQVSERVEALVERLQAGLLDRSPKEDLDEDLTVRRANRELMRRVQRVALAAARESILAARNSSGVDPAVADRVLQRLDLQSSLLTKR